MLRKGEKMKGKSKRREELVMGRVKGRVRLEEDNKGEREKGEVEGIAKGDEEGVKGGEKGEGKN